MKLHFVLDKSLNLKNDCSNERSLDSSGNLKILKKNFRLLKLAFLSTAAVAILSLSIQEL